MKNEKIDLAWRLVENTGANVFITGKAGTGKTTFLKRLKNESCKTIVVLAPTGIAALNAGGMTIHSFFQLSFSPYIPGIGQAGGNSRFSKYSKDKIKLLRSIDTIVIDEISMVRADVLDAIDAKLRRFRNPGLPLGGVQLVMIGDIQQLPPVVRDEEWKLLADHYRSPYFFDSHLLRTVPYETIELTKVYRQNDGDFIRILNAIRDNRMDAGMMNKLNTRYIEGFDPDDEERYIRLMTHNYQSQKVNEYKMNDLPSNAYVFEAVIEGEFPEMIYPAERRLTLKEGAQVMFVKNDSVGGHRYYNGLIGRIKSISDDRKIIVSVDDDTRLIDVEPEIWENTAYTVDDKSKEMKEKVVGRFGQIPLRAAWAITIHKSQGLTFDKVIVNASAAFAHGQTYVALSRCRSLEGLVLEKPLPSSAIICDRNVTEFERACSVREADTTVVDRLQADYNLRLDLEITDLTTINNALDMLHRALQTSHASSFPKQTAQFGDLFNKEFRDLYMVSLRFQEQLRHMSAKGCPGTQIYERLKAASSYFLKELHPICEFIKNLPQEVDNKEALKKFTEAITLVEFEFKLKETLMTETLSKKLKASDILKIRREVSLSPSSWIKNDRKKGTLKVSADIDNPELYNILVGWRNEKASEEVVPAYMILGNKSLVFLANEMPEEKSDLLAIPGLGRKKIADYGEELLSIIRDYKNS